jgi:hypothetical protein
VDSEELRDLYSSTSIIRVAMFTSIR